VATGLKLEATEPYPELVLRCFHAPVHAGDLPPGAGQSAAAERSESAQGATVQLAIRVQEGKIDALRYRVFGCPYLIAAAELTCSRYEGAAVAELKQFSALELLEELHAPVEKTGRLLLLEDTISSLLHGLDD
jgi:NifU-like protein involved in Fe-S cluster formation